MKSALLFLCSFLLVCDAAISQSQNKTFESYKVKNGNIITTGDDISKNANEYLKVLLLQEDKKLIAAALSFIDYAGYYGTLIRYKQDGNIDTTFGHKGYVHTNDTAIDHWLYDAKLQTDGKIIVLGNVILNCCTNFYCLKRYNSDGSIDPTFGNNGTTSIPESKESLAISDK